MITAIRDKKKKDNSNYWKHQRYLKPMTKFKIYSDIQGEIKYAKT